VACTARALRVGADPGIEPRLVLVGRVAREDRVAYRRAGGYAAGGLEGRELIDAIESSALRGRGGAGFPSGLKLRAVADRGSPRYLIANGEEGEPASVKDRYLLRTRPHLVLDGVLRVARAVGVERVFVYVSDYASTSSVCWALDELAGPDIPIEVFAVEPGYVAGEETAAVRAIEGGPPKPTAKPPRPYEEGIAGCPTLVLNVETLANVPLVALEGPAAFASYGTPGSSGTFLSTISGACRDPGLYELPLGVELAEAIGIAGGFSDRARGFLMGGFFAGLLGPRAVDLPLAYDELREAGSGLGCGAVIVLGEGDCPVAASADVMAYFARENAKQCGPCIRGTAAMRDVLLALAGGSAQEGDLERLRGWSSSLRGRGACATLDGAAALAASLLREFPAAVDSHLGSACPDCGARPPSAEQESRFVVCANALEKEVNDESSR